MFSTVDSMVGCQPRARLDEAGVPLRNRDREPRADDSPLARPDLRALARDEVEPGIAHVGALGDDRVLVQALEERAPSPVCLVRCPILLEDEERCEPAKVGVAQTRAHEDAFLAIDPLVDRRAQLVQLGELVARVVRDQEPDGLEPFGESRGNSGAQLVEPLARLEPTPEARRESCSPAAVA